MIAEYEALFLHGLTKYLGYVLPMSDLEKTYLSRLTRIVYEKLIEIEPRTEEDLSLMYIDLLKNKKITSEEYHFIETEKYDIALCTPKMLVKAYNELKKREAVYKSIFELQKIEGTKDYDEFKAGIQKASEAINQTINISTGFKLSEIGKQEPGKVLRFGLSQLDRIINPSKNCLIVLGARQFSGKTQFALKLAMENCQLGEVVFLTMELSKEQIADRLISYGPVYNDSNLTIYESANITLENIEKIIIYNKPVLVVIDQFNKIESTAKTEYESFTKNARKLKELTNRTQTPILCLSQLNRTAEGKEPNASQFKGSGSLEEEADVCLLLTVDRESNTTEVLVVKNRTTRYGTIGKFRIKYNKETGFYYE